MFYGRLSIIALIIWMVFTGYHLETTRTEILLADLPKEFEGLRIALLSDIHSGLWITEGYLERIAEEVNKLNPDMIIIAGDFITDSLTYKGPMARFTDEYLCRLKEPIESMSAPLGFFAVSGNHDHWATIFYLKKLVKMLRKSGVVFLRNQAFVVERNNAALVLLGVDDYWSNTFNLSDSIDNIPKEFVKCPRLLISHNPDINEIIRPEMRISLILSGHTHGGQFNFPIIGAPVMTSPFGEKYRAGLVRDNDRFTYVTRGVGFLLLPLRFNCRPEISEIILKSYAKQ